MSIVTDNPHRIAVIGAGWAGCAAALELSARGFGVDLLEAARLPGGRARRLERHDLMLDNGQHIMLGAYSECLRLLRLCKVREQDVLLRLPLQMPYPNASIARLENGEAAGMHFQAPRLPAPLHLLCALLSARGLSGADKMALARFSSSARWMDWQLDHDCSVAQLLERFDQTPHLIRLLWRPLCLAALNTDPEQASARIFLNVLRDSLGAKRSASDMLLPKTDLGQLLPQASLDFLAAHKGRFLPGRRVRQLQSTPDGWHLDQDCTPYQAVILATAPWQAAQILQQSPHLAAPLAPLLSTLHALQYEAICTVYLQYAPDLALARPFYALPDQAAQGDYGQFVFDRRHAGQPGLLAVVISAARQLSDLPQAQLCKAVCQQLAREFAHELAQDALLAPLWTQVIMEKRATFACHPDLSRPEIASGVRGLYLAGDYTAGDYPATLEGACRSGVRAARALSLEKTGKRR